MSDTFTETTSESWISRLSQSIKSVLVGFLLFAGAFPLLFLNEGRAVRTARSLAEGSASVVSAAPDRVDPTLEGRLVHVSGKATTQERLADPDFGVSAVAIRLVRDVEMFQWRERQKSETRTKLGGGSETVTTYEYETGWETRPVESSRFKQSEGHRNPPFPFEGRATNARVVSLGAFQLADWQVSSLGEPSELRVDAAAREALRPELRSRARVDGGAFYLGRDPQRPQVGDVRVSFGVVREGPVSVVARQVGSTFEPHHTSAGGSIALTRTGVHSAEGMLESAKAANVTATWALRCLGFALMFFGLNLMVRPIAVAGDVVPLIGNLLGVGAGLFAGLTAAAGTLVTVAVGWIFYRPLVGVLILVLAIGSAAALMVLASRRSQTRAVRHAATLG